MKKSALRLSVAILVLGFVVAVAWYYRPAKVHYRITVEVNDRGTIRSGSAVWSFALSRAILPLASPYNPRFSGEAVRVVVPGRGDLYALVELDASPEMYPENLFGDLRRPLPGGRQFMDRTDDIRHIQTLIGAKAYLSCANPPWIGVRCPKMIRFRDKRDPTSVEVIDPAHLSMIFGNGVHLSHVWVEVTDDPVTTGIDKTLPSFGIETNYHEWFMSLPFGDSRRIVKEDFERQS